MSRRQLPRAAATILDAATFLPGEIAVDTTNDELRYDGDGSTVGGIAVARKDGANLTASAALVKATGSTTSRTLATRFADTLNVLDWGVVADGTTDNTAALAAIVTYLNTLSSDQLPEVVWPANGIYSYVTSPNWAIVNLKMRFEGNVRLRCTGTGDCFIIDAGASGYAWGMAFLGWPLIEGAATTNDGVYIRSAQHSVFEFNVRGCGAKAFNVEFAVLCQFNKPTVSNNQGAFYGATPTHGMYFTRRGSGSDHSGHNIIINPILEGIPIGAYEDYVVGNTWHGGAIEGCSNTGFIATTNCRELEMFGVDFESNTTMDMDLTCDGSEFYGLHNEDLITLRSGAVNNKFFGGDFEVITVAAGANYNKFVKCGYNRYGSGAFNDSGTGTEYDLYNVTATTRIQSDYIENTYTPGLSFSVPGDAVFTTSGGSKLATGKYIRIGDLVWFEAHVSFNVAYTTDTGNFQISLPFTVANEDPAAQFTVNLVESVASPANTLIVCADALKNTDKARLRYRTIATNASGLISVTQIVSGGTEYNVRISGTFKAA